MANAGSDTRIKAATLGSPGGVGATIVNLGAALQSIRVPVDGAAVDVILSYPDLQHYGKDLWYLGTTVGRYANRIGGASFMLDGTRFELDANEVSTGHCLHGGAEGLSRQLFNVESSADSSTVTCRHLSQAGAGGFPGLLEVAVVYQLVDEYSLAIDFYANASQDTVVSLANHAYFNFGGAIDEHELQVHADSYTPVDESLIPTGEIREVANSRFDLRRSKCLGEARFDHNFVLPVSDGEIRLAAELQLPSSGIGLRLHTTQPGLQLYTADYLGAPFHSRQGLCLEAQGFPDAPNQPGFPSARLSAGEVYHQRTVYEFYIDRKGC